jgi:thymidine phosphorylase
MRPTPVRRFLRRPDDAATATLIDAARDGRLTDEEIAELARGLAQSGAQLPRDPGSADLASTGGPTSLSTLLCPLFLRARGLRVPKLGVVGRPAGGVDVLQTIPGFDAALDVGAARAALASSGYVHLIADARWAPLDARLFAYRQRRAAQAVPTLVIASILAKKLAAGVVGAGLEVRIAPHGNFGHDRAAARENAGRYKAVAGLLELTPVALLTDGSRPFQPYVGRGEALVALADVLSASADGWLLDHVNLCRAMSDVVAAGVGVAASAPTGTEALRRAHEELLVAHGADLRAFEDRVAAVRSAPTAVFSAPSCGIVDYDLDRLRELLVVRQRAQTPARGATASDPAGVILTVRPGERVESGTPVIAVRVPEGEHALAAELAGCARIEPDGRRRHGRDNGFETV